MWGRSWPGTIDDLVIETDQDTLVQQAVGTIRAGEHDLTFLHLGAPDAAGHRAGWGGDAYRRAVRASDRDLAEVVAAVADAPGDGTVLVVTADHGGVPGTDAHGAASAPANYTVPFVVWGAGIAPADLYRVNPDLADPGTGRPGYDGPQPVRNGDVANLVTDLLGLRPVPGSTFDAGHDLDVTRR